ncbi:cupin domain-containing protein [Aquisalimonas sp.]|uniref:cupin domain-containing protein n=1 Tax=Aquisalimonas sp. TaxID=1872621 RepID=UPI0025C253DC|nr:cupin domain-containing protein [Aquisalimonas sp.]
MNTSLGKPLLIVALLGLSGGLAAAAGNGHQVVVPDQIEWQEGPDFIEPGAELTLLAGDPAEGAFTARLRLPAGYDIHSHYHSGNKYLTVISGALHIGFGDELDKDQGMKVSAGSFVKVPPHHNHYEWFEEETVLQVHVTEPFEVNYVDSDLDPRNR